VLVDQGTKRAHSCVQGAVVMRRFKFSLVFLLMLNAATANASVDPATSLGQAQGQPDPRSTGVAPHVERLDRGPGPQPPADAFIASRVPRSAFGQRKVALSGAVTQQPTTDLATFRASAALTSSVTALDGAFAGISGTTEPSDGALAVGPTQVLEVVNGYPGDPNLAVFDKAGHAQLSESLNTMFGLNPATSMGDARAFYDPTTDRWFVLGFSVSFNPPAARMYLAVSESGNAAGTYCSFSKDQSIRGGVTGQAVPDFPGFAIDEYALYISMVRYPFSDLSHPFESDVEMFPRSQLSCAAPALQPFVWSLAKIAPDGRSVWVFQPTVAHEPSGVGYFVGTSLGGSYVAVLDITHSSAPLLATAYVAVVPYYPPPDSAQPGTSVLLDTSDARVPSPAVFRRGSLWFAFSPLATRSPYAAVRWYEISVPSLVVRQTGEVWNSTGSWAYPAVEVDGQGNMFLSSTAVAPTYAPRQTLLSRAPSEPLGYIGEALAVSPSGVGYHAIEPGEPSARWGDYFGIALDPDGVHVWAEGSFSSDGLSWRTSIASTHAGAASPPSPSAYRVSVSNQAPFAGTAVTVTAQALDATGQPMPSPGQTVTWRATPAGGTFSSPTSTTDARGIATVDFQTNSAAATSYTITATDTHSATGTSPVFTTRLKPTPASTLFLPNITKTLGGSSGWVTPFFVQNTGTVPADLEVTFYRFADGALVAQHTIGAIAPGTTYTDNPNLDADLPDSTQFSVVVKSYGAPVVATVNETQGVAAATQALSYTGVGQGSTRIYLPNVTRRFFGYDVPFIMQNVGAAQANIAASFISFDGTQRFTTTLSVAPGRSGVIDPDFTVGLTDGTQYAVAISSDQPLAVVVNAHNEQGAPVAFSHNGLAVGAPLVYAPYFANQSPSTGRFSPLVVQNLGSAPVDATLRFTPLGAAGPIQSFVLRAIAPGAATAFDPRFTLGTSAPCVGPSPTCLGPGEFSLQASAIGPIAAVVLPVSSTTAAAYTAATVVGAHSYLPIVSRNAGVPPNTITYVVVQSGTSSSAVMRYFRTSDGILATTQSISIPVGSAVWVDPRLVPGLGDGTYSVVVDGNGGTISAVAYEIAPSGDGAMIYEGFSVP
jgi:Big-like domain-containing protein